MCDQPVTQFSRALGREVTFACRTCNACIATRRHQWVARAMAEKACNPFALCLTLTYSENTEHSRDSARFFCYDDVRGFLHRLRSAARFFDRGAKIRFLCAGEQGDRFGRCHWHLIIYSNIDLTRLGKFRLRGKLVANRRDMITEGKRKRRLNWTLWPHGFMTVQEPDQSAMNYVLSYCLKDQFTIERSEGSMREAQAENFATGLFRMSKRPAIGEEFLLRKIAALDARGAVLPNLQIKIPEFRGYWYPAGGLRETFLRGLVAINNRIRKTSGDDCPQWSTLLASCRDNEKDMELLIGQETEAQKADRQKQETFDRYTEALAARNAYKPDAYGYVLPCRDCLGKTAHEEVAKLGLNRTVSPVSGETTYRSRPGWPALNKRFHQACTGDQSRCQTRFAATKGFTEYPDDDEES